ncbi:uncharacterized protein LOC141639131 isoform X3 [Silene latifolia]|uniref:uncharacterized protein LOC141639131 isoform X3 n=1 Tax=Silene latifolia TaxID=37657 RepID=UPI003D7750D6
MAAFVPTVKLNFMQKCPISLQTLERKVLKPNFCSSVQQVIPQEETLGILCEPCSGTGWLLCDFCNGQKTNVKSSTNKIYRRCPSCKALICLQCGYILCSKCKVFKCVTFPDQNDG